MQRGVEKVLIRAILNGRRLGISNDLLATQTQLHRTEVLRFLHENDIG